MVRAILPRPTLHAMFTLYEIKTIIYGTQEICKPIRKIHLAALVQLEMEKKRERQGEKEMAQSSAEAHILRSLNVLIILICLC